MAIDQVISDLGNIPSTADPANFDAEGDQFLGVALPLLRTELNTWRTQANSTAASMNLVAAGAAFSIPFTFSTTTADADPGAGTLRLDNATQNLAGTIRADLLGADGADYTSMLNTFDDSTNTIKGQVALVKVSDPSKFICFNVTSLGVPAGYRNIVVTPVSWSAASPFVNGDSLVLKFTRAGDQGPQGPAGANDLIVSSRTANTILAGNDKGDLTVITAGTFSQTITACATLGAGWWTWYLVTGNGTVTLDPNGAETIDGAATKTLKNGVLYQIATDGANLTTREIAMSAGDHEVYVNTGGAGAAGYGTVNTVIRRYTVTVRNVGTAITYADSATLGASFTINEDGIYSIIQCEGNSAAGSGQFGVSRNSAQLTTAIQSITAADRLGGVSKCIGGTNEYYTMNWVGRLNKGDVIRPHHGGVTTANNVVQTMFQIAKVSN